MGKLGSAIALLTPHQTGNKKKMAKDELSSRLKKFASTTEQYADDAFMNYYATRGD